MTGPLKYAVKNTKPPEVFGCLGQWLNLTFHDPAFRFCGSLPKCGSPQPPFLSPSKMSTHSRGSSKNIGVFSYESNAETPQIPYGIFHANKSTPPKKPTLFFPARIGYHRPDLPLKHLKTATFQTLFSMVVSGSPKRWQGSYNPPEGNI